ncbi:hypothetical protein EA560_25475 [Salmonella enterica]|nr:hypothetical protein [Salmonella enterica subsp. enterica serovar Pomona]
MQMSGIWICSAYVIFSLFRSDPISGGTGSSKNVRPLTAPLSQYAAHYPLLMTLYSVLTPFSVMRLAGAENSDMIISSPWYTSGKL